MREIESAFAQEYESAAPVRFNTAASNVLAQQIVASSQADVFLSANERWMDYVEKAGRLIAGTRKPFLANRMVVVAHASTDWQIDEAGDLARLELEHLSLANPEAVPAGTYAKAFLKNTPYGDGSLWDAVAPEVAPAPDVRAALALVEADPTAVGIVYRTDAMSSRRVRILFEVPENQVPPIRYSAARVYRPDAPAASSDRFFDFLFSQQARAIFTRHGFIPVPQTGAPNE